MHIFIFTVKTMNKSALKRKTKFVDDFRLKKFTYNILKSDENHTKKKERYEGDDDSSIGKRKKFLCFSLSFETSIELF